VLDLLADAIPLALVASTPLLLAVQGELFVQRSGMINLGIEGMMLIAAMAAVLGGPLAGIAGAAFAALIFGLFTITLRTDQIVTGTAINLFALGATSFLYRELNARFADPPRMDDGVLLVLTWIVIPIVLAVVLWNSSFGLRLRACGENPDAVEAAGHSVAFHRWSALAIEALLTGLAGAHLSLALSSGFAENMTAGRGFIALSIVIFGRWKVRGVLLGTAVFGLAAALQYALQAANRGVPFHLLLAVPYVVTLLSLAVLSAPRRTATAPR
jgi:ABC-type uncharacterized transport system permease subunit